MNLLIVDDHSGMREMIRGLIGHLATQIRECASGEDAVELCESFAPDCVTLDVHMGAMDGFACAQRIRERHLAAHIAIVTQFDHEALRTRAIRAGADIFVVKEKIESLVRYVESIARERGDNLPR